MALVLIQVIRFGSAYPNSDGIIVTISADYHKRIIQILNGAKQ